LAALGRALRDREAITPAAVTALRLIALTGLRREEACGLRWREIDVLGQSLRLEATKTGRSLRPIGKVALALLQSLPGSDSRGSAWVFPRRDGQGSADLKRRIGVLFNAAELPDARSHDLRRTYASIAADLGYSDATIAELLGHARRGVTERHYVRRADAVLLAAADAVASRTAWLMGDRTQEAVVVPLRPAGAAG
jgi:integrase